MVKIAVVGDLHLQERNPGKRIDNYFNKALNKIERIRRENDYLIILGDFFSSPSMSLEYLAYTANTLLKYKGSIHTILGNHDAYYRTLNLNKTAIGLLDKVGVVKLELDTFEIEGVSFDVASVVPELKLPEKKSDILLGHFYLDNGFAPKESMKVEDLKEYKHVFLGHDHSPYEILEVSGLKIYRNGSLMRTDSSDYNMKRDVITYTQIDDGVFKQKTISVDSPKDIFTIEAINKSSHIVKRDFGNLESLMEDFNPFINKDNMSTLKVLEDLETPEPCKEYLNLVHESLGLVF